MNAYHLAALPPALLLIARPQLWPWALAVAAFVALAAIGAAAHYFRGERDEALAEVARLARELCAAYESLNSVLDEHERCPAPVATRLQLVPAQRDGSEYEWPRIARVLGIEAGEV